MVFADLLHLVDRVVHRVGEILDAVAVERGDEGAADRGQHLAGDVVGVVLAVDDGLEVLLDAVAAVEQRPQRLGARDQRVRVPGEQLEKAPFLRQQQSQKTQHPSLSGFFVLF